MPLNLLQIDALVISASKMINNLYGKVKKRMKKPSFNPAAK